MPGNLEKKGGVGASVEYYVAHHHILILKFNLF